MSADPADVGHGMTLLAEDGSVTMSPAQLRLVRDSMTRFLMDYEFALREVVTKLQILQDEFSHVHDYNPIEHLSSRVKSPESLIAKITRLGIPPDLEMIRQNVHDIAGVRVTCSFIGDVYRLFDLLTQQDDITVRLVKDYIATPKPNGYKSLHALVEVPIYLSSGRRDVEVEIQFRTIAMDFWASLEHKIYYRYERDVPTGLLAELKDAADTAAELDHRMERLHRELHGPARAVTNDFDDRAATWDDDPDKVRHARSVADAVAAALPLGPRTRLLEYGAGTGLVTQALADRVGPVMLIDTSAGMRQMLATKIAAGTLPHDARVGDHDMGQGQAPQERFDAVVASMVLHHVPDLEAVLRTFAAVLEPGGHLAVVDLDREDGSFHAHLPAFHGHHGFDREQLRTLLRAAGFTKVRIADCGTVDREGTPYPLFLATAQVSGVGADD